LDSRLVIPVNTVLDGNYRIMRVVGSGGFGITYEAEDMNLGTMVAIKEYYPEEFGDRDSTMSVRPKSDRHKATFDWGRSSFLQEARTLARFEHPSIVRVTRVFETNSTAYMVMRFEAGLSFGDWLTRLGRPPTQEELDAVTAPLLDALQVMHAANFIHRDIAPDNIIIRADGTPVLLDFGAARRAVAEMSRSLTGIVKAGYSPHEQYATDGRLQGPWSDLYALGGTLYRAVTGKPPEEATLRFDEDHLAPASQVAKGKYRRDFLTAIDTCLKVKHSERPRSVAQLRPMLLGPKSQPQRTERFVGPTFKIRSKRALSDGGRSTVRRVAQRWPAIAATVGVIAGVYGWLQYRPASEAEARYQPVAEASIQQQAAPDAERRQKEEAADARQRQIEVEEARRRKEIADAQRQAEIEDARRRKDLADAAEVEAGRKAEAAAEAKRKEEIRIAALEEARRQEEARRKGDAGAEEKHRTAALEEARRKAEANSKEKRKEDERLRLAAIPTDEERTAFVKRIQEVLKNNQCYSGSITGRPDDAQQGVDRFVENAGKKGNAKPPGIKLAKASVGDFESWFKDVDAVRWDQCVPQTQTVPKPKAKPHVSERVAKARPLREERASSPARPSPSYTRSYQGGGGGGGGGGASPMQGIGH